MSQHLTMSPGEVDRLAIRELIEAYAHCADRRDANGQMSLFTADTARKVQIVDFGSLVGASRVITARRESQSPGNYQRIGTTRRRVPGKPRRNFPFRVPLPRCCGHTSGPAAGTRQPSHCRRQHECCYQGGGYCGFRKFSGPTFLSWTAGWRDHSRSLDDGSCPTRGCR
jgi:hypothetical protein